jgi:hypothetical protein
MKTTETAPLLPMPERKRVKMINVPIDENLYRRARIEMNKRRMTLRMLAEWALSSYLAKYNPEEAERLGIKAAC